MGEGGRGREGEGDRQTHTVAYVDTDKQKATACTQKCNACIRHTNTST